MDNKYTKEFIDYLFYIGILSKESIQPFISFYNSSVDQYENKSNEQNTIISEALTNYLSSLNKGQIKNISKMVVFKYAENVERIRQKYLLGIINSKHNKAVKLSFYKWKKTIKKIDGTITPSIGISYNLIKSNRITKDNFINRQEQYIQMKKDKKQKLSSKTEEDLLQQCTFSPKIFSTKEQMSPCARNKKAVDRLLEDSNRRLEEYNKKQYELSNKNRSSFASTGSVSNKKTFDKLYQNAKDRENYKKTLQQQIDFERGMTFKPASFTKDCGYEVSNNFYDRNQKLIDDRQNFVFVYDYLRQSKYNDQSLYKSNQLIQKAIEANERELGYDYAQINS